MRGPGKLAQHVRGVGKVLRLAEYLAVLHHHGVGAQHDDHAGEFGIGQNFLHHGSGLAFGQLLGRLGRVGHQVGLQRLVHVGHAHGEGDAGVLQQLPAAGAATR